MPVQPTVHPALCASGHSPALSDARLLSALATLRDALAPGKALNLPAVLDRAALLEALSVLTTNTPAPVPTTGYPAPTSVRLDRLANGELAIAIHAAGIPAKAHTLTTEQIQALAVAGIARLGMTEIRRINTQWRTANTVDCDKTHRAEIRRLWGSAQKAQTAVDLAYRLRCALTRGQETA